MARRLAQLVAEGVFRADAESVRRRHAEVDADLLVGLTEARRRLTEVEFHSGRFGRLVTVLFDVDVRYFVIRAGRVRAIDQLGEDRMDIEQPDRVRFAIAQFLSSSRDTGTTASRPCRCRRGPWCRLSRRRSPARRQDRPSV